MSDLRLTTMLNKLCHSSQDTITCQNKELYDRIILFMSFSKIFKVNWCSAAQVPSVVSTISSCASKKI